MLTVKTNTNSSKPKSKNDEAQVSGERGDISSKNGSKMEWKFALLVEVYSLSGLFFFFFQILK